MSNSCDGYLIVGGGAGGGSRIFFYDGDGGYNTDYSSNPNAGGSGSSGRVVVYVR